MLNAPVCLLRAGGHRRVVYARTPTAETASVCECVCVGPLLTCVFVCTATKDEAHERDRRRDCRCCCVLSPKVHTTIRPPSLSISVALAQCNAQRVESVRFTLALSGGGVLRYVAKCPLASSSSSSYAAAAAASMRCAFLSQEQQQKQRRWNGVRENYTHASRFGARSARR